MAEKAQRFVSSQTQNAAFVLKDIGIFAWMKSAIIHFKEGFAMTTIRAVIHDRRIDVPAPNELPDGTEVVLTIGTPVGEDGPMTPCEIERVLAAMQRLEPLELPEEVAADLEAWESKLNQRGLNHVDQGMEETFQ